MTFQEFCSDIPHGLWSEFRRRVIFEVPISDQMFRNWQKGLYVPSDECKEKINAIAIDLTGKPIY